MTTAEAKTTRKETKLLRWRVALAGLLLIATVATASASGPEDTCSYVVKSGDTMSKIAQQAEMSLGNLIKLNPQITDPHWIYPGESINLCSSNETATPTPPAKPTPAATPTAASQEARLAGSPAEAQPLPAGKTSRVSVAGEGWFKVVNPGAIANPAATCVLGCESVQDFTVEAFPPEKTNAVVTAGDYTGSTKLTADKNSSLRRIAGDIGNRDSAGAAWLWRVTSRRPITVDVYLGKGDRTVGRCVTYQDGFIPWWVGCEGDQWWDAVPDSAK